MNTKSVTVSRLSDEAINELDERIGLIWREEINGELEELLPDEQMTTFNQLIIGYDSAWDEIDRLRKALNEANEALSNIYYKSVEAFESDDDTDRESALSYVNSTSYDAVAAISQALEPAKGEYNQ